MKFMNICDLHAHVLPGVDDGAPTMEYALQMLQNAAASDVKMLAVTPHCNGPCGKDNLLYPDIRDRFLRLQKAAQGIPVELVMGAEVRVNEGLPEHLSRREIPTINGGRYLLTEFAIDTKPEMFMEMLQKILSLGYIPLVAHPERYHAVCNAPQIVLPWLDLGCHLQLTGGSIRGDYGKSVQHTANYLLQQDLVACVASDAHGVNGRSNYLLDIYDHLAVFYSKPYAKCLLYENPVRICGNDDIG